MNDLVRFSQGVQMATGRKRGRRPVFNSRMFYPYKEELRLRLLLKKELERYIAEAYAVAVQGEIFSDDLNALSNLGENLPEDFRNEVTAIGQSIARHVSNTIANSSEMIVGKPYYPPEAKADIFRSWEANFQTLCKSAESDAKKEISRLVTTAKNEGWNGRQLEKAVMKELPAKYAHRAELIARTESAKLNSEVTRATYREIGCQYYKWMATPDERTRPDHAAMNGVICSVDDPTVYFEENPDDPLHPVPHGRTGEMCQLHPGEDFQCRCTMVMWDPEIDGQYEVKETPKPEPEEKEPTKLEQAREETEKAEARAEKAEEETAKAEERAERAEKEIHGLKSRVHALENREKNVRTASIALEGENPTGLKDAVRLIRQDVTVNYDIPKKALSVSILNDFRREYLKQVQITGIGKFDRIAQHFVSGEPLAFETPNTLRINVQELRDAFENPMLFFRENVESLEKKGNLRFLAIDTAKNVKRHMIAHEVGHKVFYLSKLQDKERKLKELYERAAKDGMIDKIGFYAKKSAEFGDYDELIAEIYAMWSRKDVSLPGYMSEFVEEILK